MISTRHSRHSRPFTTLARILTLIVGVAAASTIARAQAPTKAAPPAKSPQATIMLTTKPNPVVTGDNVFDVTVKAPDGTPVVGADVSVLFVMPGMPSMNMPEMKNTVALKATTGKDAVPGTYTGHGQVMMAGTWNVTVSVKVGGKDFADKKLTVTSK